MASLWQKQSGLWCVTYRENGKKRTRSLRTRDKREARKLKRAIETTLEKRGTVVLDVSDRPKSEYCVDFKKGFQTVCDAAGIQTTPHALRHSFASRQAVAGNRKSRSVSYLSGKTKPRSSPSTILKRTRTTLLPCSCSTDSTRTTCSPV